MKKRWLGETAGKEGRKKRKKQWPQGHLCFLAMRSATSPGRGTAALLPLRGAPAADTPLMCTWTVANRQKGQISFHTITIHFSHSLSTWSSLGLSSRLLKRCEVTQADKPWLHGGGSSGWGVKSIMLLMLLVLCSNTRGSSSDTENMNTVKINRKTKPD